MNSVIVDENELDSTRLLPSNPFLYPGFSCEICRLYGFECPGYRESHGCKGHDAVVSYASQCNVIRPIPPSIPLQTSA